MNEEPETFYVMINTGNDAFQNGERNWETARILRHIADMLEHHAEFDYFRTLFDLNGNDVGRAAFKPADYIQEVKVND